MTEFEKRRDYVVQVLRSQLEDELEVPEAHEYTPLELNESGQFREHFEKMNRDRRLSRFAHRIHGLRVLSKITSAEEATQYALRRRLDGDDLSCHMYHEIHTVLLGTAYAAGKTENASLSETKGNWMFCLCSDCRSGLLCCAMGQPYPPYILELFK